MNGKGNTPEAQQSTDAITTSLALNDIVNNNTMIDVIAIRGVRSISIQGRLAGRLELYLNNWQVVTKDRWVLNTVNEYQIEFHSPPYQDYPPHQPQINKVQEDLINVEIQKLLEKGAVTTVHFPQDSFFSTLFLVPSKVGGLRPVINLKPLKNFVNTHHFKLEGINSLKTLLSRANWLVKMNFIGAYFSIATHPEHQKYLNFTWRNTNYLFIFHLLDLALAPWVFTKTLRLAAALGRELGMRMVCYIDDISVMA
uniref:Reverse transcriptase domain-containing protein n=1 Tax=Amphimedon queenslandica TaxID=400682 RepID=A0A1X7V580_AMPQE